MDKYWIERYINIIIIIIIRKGPFTQAIFVAI